MFLDFDCREEVISFINNIYVFFSRISYFDFLRTS